MRNFLWAVGLLAMGVPASGQTLTANLTGSGSTATASVTVDYDATSHLATFDATYANVPNLRDAAIMCPNAADVLVRVAPIWAYGGRPPSSPLSGAAVMELADAANLVAGKCQARFIVDRGPVVISGVLSQ